MPRPLIAQPPGAPDDDAGAPDDDEDILDELEDEDEGLDEEEDELEDEDEYEVRASGKGKKRQRRSAAAAFIDDIADVDEEEEDEDEEGEEGLADLIASNADAEEAGRGGSGRHRALLNELQRGGGEDMDGEELERFIKERYKAKEYHEEDIGEGALTEIEQQGLVPSVQDPKLWLVQTRPTHEREAVIQLMAKGAAIATGTTKGEPMLIHSALAVDGLSGYIYVEAYKESHVRAACMNLRNMYTRKIQLVPLREMTNVMNASKSSTQNLTEGCYVRPRGGAYKGDLGQVLGIDARRGIATVRLVPRLDYPRIAAKVSGVTFETRGRPRPTAKLFDATDAYQRTQEQVYNDVVCRADGKSCLEFNGQQFRHGLLLKPMSMKTLGIESNPQFEEIERFRQADEVARAGAEGEDGEEGGAQGLAATGVKVEGRKVVFHKGDSVQVIEGDLVGLVGSVVFVSGGQVKVRPDDDDISDVLDFPAEQLRKHFTVGSHVKVTAGVHEGTTGMITRIDQNVGVAYLISDMGNEEVKCFVDDLSSVSASATGQTASDGGAYQVHDLVQLDADTFGVVISAQRDSLQVLTSKGEFDQPDVRTVRVATIQRKIFHGRNQSVQDRHMNDVKAKDMVQIVEGAGARMKVSVEHVWRGSIFGRCREYPLYGGRVHVKSQHVAVLGGSKRTLVAPPPAAMADPTAGALGSQTPSRVVAPSPMHTPAALGGAGGGFAQQPYGAGAAGGFGGGFGGNFGAGPQVTMDQSRRMEGQRIKVSKGPWKGYWGRIKKVTNTHFKVEFEATMKLAMVDRKHVKDAGIGMPAMGAPMEADVPNRDLYGRTPAHGGMTPAHPGSATPMRSGGDGSAWNPMAAPTPRHEPNYAGSYGAADTPGGMGAPTPGGYGGYHANANTPYVPGETPAAHTPYESTATPGGAYGGAATPGGYANAPTPGAGYDPYAAATPAGGDNPYAAATPGGNFSAPTPGGHMNAATPGAGGAAVGPALFPLRAEIAVKLARASADATYVVVDPGTGSDTGDVLVAPLDDPSATQSVPRREVSLVEPEKGNDVVILFSNVAEQIGERARLFNIDGTEGILKLSSDQDVVFCELIHLGKLVA